MTVDLDDERVRIAREYERRRTHVDESVYAPWHAAAALNHASRVRLAAVMLKAADVFPRRGERVLEVGCGQLGWLSDMLGFGVLETDLAGIDLDARRVEQARAAFPAVDLKVGDASAMPFADAAFHFVIASTLFTSILSDAMRRAVAAEITRVLKPGGALLWYDFAYDNPKNANVRGVRRSEIRSLFPSLHGDIRAVTLAPPLARIVAPRSWVLATALEALPFLRTHLIAVLVKLR